MSDKACVSCFAPLSGGPVCPRCGFDNAAYRPKPHHLPPGTILWGHYVVGRAMGQGGFGITYAGFDTRLDRRVAIKEYFPEGTAIREAARTTRVSCYADTGFQERYGAGLRKCVNEARSLARLDDIPGIVRVLEYFQENNTVYIVMEFVEGVTLVDYLKRLPQRPGYREALSLLAPVGAALGEIHARGFVHRDVSPDNIMIAPNGRPKLLDFGAVKTVTEGGAATESPVIKRGFSPVEMYSTDGMIGPWSDVYGYCATLFYVLTGAAAQEPMNRLQKDTLGECLSRVVSPAQTEALRKGMAFQPDQRYQTAAEMSAALTACRDDPAPVPKTSPLSSSTPETEAVDRPAPETIPIGEPGQRKTEPAAAPETKALSGPAPTRPAPAKTSHDRPAPEKAGAFAVGQTDFPKTGKKKKFAVVIAAVVTALAVLCIVIAVFVAKLFGGMSAAFSSQTPSTAQTSSAAQAPAATQAPPATQAPTTIQTPATTIPPTTALADTVAARIASANVGDYVTFGKYEQDNDLSNGKEDIEWQILAKEYGKALLLSRYGLDCKPYNSEYTNVTWETCTLRTWLNSAFASNAFSSDEQGQIVSNTVTANRNPDFNTNPGNDTTDKIFLLSIQEAEKYFSSDKERICQATAYTLAQGAYIPSTGCWWWWLRSPGQFPKYAAYVDYYGSVFRIGDYVSPSEGAVRPALWIDLTV